VDGAVGSGDREGAVGREVERPSVVVDGVVVVLAQGEEVPQVGGAESFPVVEMVDVAPVGGRVALGERAGAVEGTQCPALGPVGDPFGAAEVEDAIA
jgi:hypothetical protein